MENRRWIKDIDKCIDYNNHILKFSNNDQIISSMQIIEKEHWRYIDQYHRVKRYAYPNIKFYDFIERSLILTNNEKLTENVKKYYRIYDKYKKSLPTAGAVILHGDKILLIRNYSGNVYSLPKGKSKEGETLEQTAIREVQEETGLELDEIIPIVDSITVYKTKLYIVESDYMIKNFSGYDQNEISEIKWFSQSFIRKYPEKFSKQTKAVINELFD